MKEAVRRRALELGFDACRFTTAQPPATGLNLQRWLAEGCHGQMEYLARNAAKRLDPEKVLARAQSIVTLAVNYNSSAMSGSGQPQENRLGQIARYAQYQDYHDVLKPPLRDLANFIDSKGGPETRSLWYTDTGPLLERDLARRSGLGFVGKHTNLIHRRLGNWIFLAEIITTVEFEPDSPEQNRCGSCERCISACPTHAITAPFQLDSRRCISYLTIELKGSIPLELRPLIGNRIYGCDDCLAVCPWNRFASEAKLMKTHAREDLAMPHLVDLLALDEAGFLAKFGGTPIVRTKRRGLLRNVCVALGNTGDDSVLPALQKAAEDPEPLIAEHARWAIDQIVARRTKT